MMLITIATFLLFNCVTVFCRTESVNKEAARALYTLTHSCKDTCQFTENEFGLRFSGQNSCYKYFDRGQSWSDAEAKCNELGAHLIKFDSNDEMIQTSNFLNTYYRVTYNRMWTGLNDEVDEGSYKWVGFGGELSSEDSMWDNDQPDNYGALWLVHEGEDCVEFNGAKLNDFGCGEALPFICEKELL